MSEQALDVRSAVAIVRRWGRWLTLAAVLGGVALTALVSVVLPPQYSSISQVLLPQAPRADSGQAAARDKETEAKIAVSDIVLGPAGQAVSPQLTTNEVFDRVTVTAATGDILQIAARGDSAAAAEALAQAVAEAEVAYQAEANSSLTGIQREELETRLEDLDHQQHVVNREIRATKRRLADADPASEQGKADASVLSQLTSQQSDLVLQANTLQDRLDAAQTGAATVIQRAAPAKRPRVVLYYLITWGLGTLLAGALASAVAIGFGRRDRRLRARDEIADALGSTVLASVRSRVPRDAAGWSTLMETYEPEIVDAWALRQALEILDIPQLVAGTSTAGAGAARPKARRSPAVITLVSLSDDQRGLAVAVQLASYVASLGVPTTLTTLHRHDSAAAFWAACSTFPRGAEARPGLRIDSHKRPRNDSVLIVRVAVVDRRSPAPLDFAGTPVTVMSLASGTATAEDLARVAVSLFESGGRIAGVVVADPDTLDRTTGRLQPTERARQLPLPTRLTGLEPGSAGTPGEGGTS